jgi:LPS-assembly lipoprotein
MSLRRTPRFNRRFLLILPLLALGACGFQPVYGSGGTGAALQNRVLVDTPDDRFGYFLVRELETRLGRTNAPAYGLGLTITTEEDGLAIDSTGTTTRYNILGTADFALRDLTTGQIVTSGKVESFTGYSATGTTVATLAAEQDAQKRLMTILADQIVTRLHATDLTQ